MDKMTWIKEVTTENIGGGTMVDFVYLKDGRVLGITEDSAVLYEDRVAFDEAAGDEPVIYFPRRTTVIVHQTVDLEYEIEVVGEVNADKVAKIMDELSWPDATKMETDDTWYYEEIKGGGLRMVPLCL